MKAASLACAFALVSGLIHSSLSMRRSIAAMMLWTSWSAAAFVSGGKYLRDVQLADVVAERADGEVHAALPPDLLLRSSGQGRAVESEILLVERRRQIRQRRRRANAPAAGPSARQAALCPPEPQSSGLRSAERRCTELTPSAPLARINSRKSKLGALLRKLVQRTTCCRSWSRRGSRRVSSCRCDLRLRDRRSL